jgi:hypothetical protein
MMCSRASSALRGGGVLVTLASGGFIAGLALHAASATAPPSNHPIRASIDSMTFQLRGSAHPSSHQHETGNDRGRTVARGEEM